MIGVSGILLVLSLMMITSQASAGMNGTNNTIMSSPQKNHAHRPAVKSLDYGDYYRDWRDWYEAVVEKPFYLHVNDVFLGKLTLSRNKRLEISTPVSGDMMTRITFGGRGVTVLPDRGGYNLGLGITTRMRNGLSIDASVNFVPSDPSDVTFWLTLPSIRF